jgi:ABC-type uncharacterized transport system substrate-binding protein
MFSRRHVRRLLRLAASFALLACGSVYAAGPPEVVVLAREQQPIHRELVNSLREVLAEKGADAVRIMSVAQFTKTTQGRKQSPQPELIVAVGTEVTQQVTALDLPAPVLSVAIPRLSFEEVRQRDSGKIAAGRRGGLSAIYLDQPLERRLELIQQILPEARRIGVVLGPGTLAYASEFRAAAERRRLELRVGRVADETQLIRTLDQVLRESDVMLGVVDPLVFNRASARNVLLTAYRWRVPLFGVSPAYVRAGALAAVFSTPEHIARQLAETIEGFRIKGARKLPPPQYPKYFSVVVNYQVAESMGIHVDDEDSLQRRLSNQGSAAP